MMKQPRRTRKVAKIAFAILTCSFAALCVWLQRLPSPSALAWSVRDAAIRIGAIVSGVGAVLVAVALLLPTVLNALESRGFTSFVAARHVRSQKSGFLTIISVLSICGIAISSCALSSVVSVMGGFSQDLKRKILGNNAHIVIDTTAGTNFADFESALSRVREIPGIVGATGVVRGEVLASSSTSNTGVIVTGIDPATVSSVIDIQGTLEAGKLSYLEHPESLLNLPPDEVIGIGPGGLPFVKGAPLTSTLLGDDSAIPTRVPSASEKPVRPGIIVGRESAKTLHVYVGDEITLVSPLGDLGPMGVMPRTKKFRVAGIFYSAMYEYDSTCVYTLLGTAQEYFQTQNKISAIEIKVKDAEESQLFAEPISAAVRRPELRLRDWRDINKNLFSALQAEHFAAFLILSIAIVVASFCIVCTLLLMVTEKGKEIAILKALGASDSAIRRTFMKEGMILGGIGTAFGTVTGLALCIGLRWFGLRLDPEIYYIDRLPISVNALDFVAVAFAAMAISTLSTLYPAYAASQLKPVEGLRDA